MDFNQVIGQVAAVGFVIGAIFWAGATYQRIGRIEKDLTGLVGQLAGLGEIETLKSQIHTHSEEIVLLRKAVFGDRWRQFGGAGKNPGDS